MEQRNKKVTLKEYSSTKTCSYCKVDKPLTEFHKCSRSKDGKQSRCKSCVKSYAKKYQNKNREYFREKSREYSKNNREYFKDYCLNYYHSNKEKFRVYQNTKRVEDPEYRFNRVVLYHMYGVADRNEFKDKWDDIREVYDFYGIEYHIDHLIPRTWFKINSDRELINHIDNLQVIDAKYNFKKSNNWSDPIPQKYYDMVLPYIKDEYKELISSIT